VGYVFDRKAAVLVYALRQHLVTLLVFRTEGLAWPDVSTDQTRSARGFNVVLWRGGELGYALVSDANAKELSEIGVRLADAGHQPGLDASRPLGFHPEPITSQSRQPG